MESGSGGRLTRSRTVPGLEAVLRALAGRRYILVGQCPAALAASARRLRALDAPPPLAVTAAGEVPERLRGHAAWFRRPAAGEISAQNPASLRGLCARLEKFGQTPSGELERRP